MFLPSFSQLFLNLFRSLTTHLAGNIGRMYKEGVEREVTYVIEKDPKMGSRERLVLNDLVDKMRLTQSNIEQLANLQTNASTVELSALEEKINSIKTNLNEIWTNMKTSYSDLHAKSTNVSYVLDRLDFLDPKQVKLAASELQTQLNKLWKDLSRNLMQTVDRIDMGVKRLTEQTVKEASRHLNKEVDLIKRKISNATHESMGEKGNLQMPADLMAERNGPERNGPERNGGEFVNLSNRTRFDLILRGWSRRLANLNRLSNLIRGKFDEDSSDQPDGRSESGSSSSSSASHSNLVLKSEKTAGESADKEADNDDKVPLSRYLRSVDRLQAESERLFANDLKSLANVRFRKLAKLQEANDSSSDEDDMNGSNDGSDSSSDDSNGSSGDGSLEVALPDFQNETQLKKFTNMLRGQFNQSINQFTNYWRNLGKKINEHRRNFNNQTSAGRKLNFDPFGFRFGKQPDLDQDSFYGDDHGLNDYSDYSSSFYSHNC